MRIAATAGIGDNVFLNLSIRFPGIVMDISVHMHIYAYPKLFL